MVTRISLQHMGMFLEKQMLIMLTKLQF